MWYLYIVPHLEQDRSLPCVHTIALTAGVMWYLYIVPHLEQDQVTALHSHYCFNCTRVVVSVYCTSP